MSEMGVETGSAGARMVPWLPLLVPCITQGTYSRSPPLFLC